MTTAKPDSGNGRLTPDEVRAALRGERRYIPERGRSQKIAFYRAMLEEETEKFQDQQQRFRVLSSVASRNGSGLPRDVELQFLSDAAYVLECMRVCQGEIARLVEGIPEEAIEADAEAETARDAEPALVSPDVK